jgi:glycosyltransferase involved in cell wall biosynthesis
VHGTYKAEQDRGERFEDDLIHVVYAGTFDPRKGGVAAAIAAAEFLPANYHVHILGFGSEPDTQTIKNAVTEVAEKSKAKITFEGLLSGEDYIRFLQKCHIGLSTQNPEADFNATSFPSKILSYMANGLNVVSVRIPAVETSAVADLINFYDEQTPEQIAATILQVNLNSNADSRLALSELNEKFEFQLKMLLDS